jgi:shikimate kinase
VTAHTNIYLVGLMGVGKSTIGKKLASRLGVSFIDCDQELERRNGVTVSTIFDIEGESGFRKRETRLLEELVEQDIGVIATGGGVVTQKSNRALLKNKGCVIYLNASVDLLWSRLRYCKNRPLLENQNPKKKLQALYQQRDPLYREVATTVVSVGKGSALNTARKIEQVLINP